MATKIKFYDVVDRKSVTTSDYDVRRTKNDRLQAIASHKGRKLYRFLKG